jgi:hypothetical protein
MMAKREVQNERLRHIEAFEYYYSLGEKRSLKKVAERFGVGLRQAETWSSSFDWQDRIKERDRKVGELLAEQNIQAIAKAKTEYREVIEELVNRFKAKLISNKDANLVNSVSSLEKLVKLDMLLMGEADSRNEEVLTKKLEDWL